MAKTRFATHAYFFIWLVDKIQSEEIDKIILTEIPDRNIDQEINAIVATNMIHGPCDVINITAPCMNNGKCTKSFPKNCINYTISIIDGYQFHRRRDTDQSYKLRM
jgi:hypothetical protein